jgi:methylphosphotriester-DNA--protein-cysteine methyltransferase
VKGETEREAMATVLEARQRHYGVSAKQARDERLGTSLGRLAFREAISDVQYQAGLPSQSSTTSIT